MSNTSTVPPPLAAGHYVLGLGSNVGTRLANLEVARWLLECDDEIQVLEASRVFETDPLGPPQDDFLNAALKIETNHSAEAVLEKSLAVERRLGRVRAERWGPRIVDIDVLEGPVRLQSSTLTVPHPELRKRPFALAPLFDVAPECAQGHGYHAGLQPHVHGDALAIPISGSGAPPRGRGSVAGHGTTLLEAYVRAFQQFSLVGAGTSERSFSVRSLEQGAAELLSQISEGLQFRCLTVNPPTEQAESPPGWVFRLFGTGYTAERAPRLGLSQLREEKSAGKYRVEVLLS